jgi:hypothetical protein
MSGQQLGERARSFLRTLLAIAAVYSVIFATSFLIGWGFSAGFDAGGYAPVVIEVQR